MNSTLGFPNPGSLRWNTRQRLVIALAAVTLAASTAVATLAQLDRGSSAPAPVAPPAARVDAPAAPQPRYIIAATQHQADSFRTWLTYESPELAGNVETFIVASQTEAAAVYEAARDVRLYDSVSISVVDLRDR